MCVEVYSPMCVSHTEARGLTLDIFLCCCPLYNLKQALSPWLSLWLPRLAVHRALGLTCVLLFTCLRVPSPQMGKVFLFYSSVGSKSLISSFGTT